MCLNQNHFSCDIFCRVIDNYGDAGVAWRLAVSLADEQGWKPRLVIDDLTTLSRLVPEIEPTCTTQRFGNVDIALWDDAFEATVPKAPADVVIEAFSCYLPEKYEAAIAETAQKKPVAVIALDYLTAEDYAETSHALASPHPRYGYPKRFFFPGFTPKTGGIIREKLLMQQHAQFDADNKRFALLENLGADPHHPFTLFFFTYPTTPVKELARQIAEDSRPTQIIMAPGEASQNLAEALDALAPPHVTYVHAPMVPQRAFDELLWACDALLVRGEDSAARAQLSGKPMLWTLYPQTENTHITKLQAFAARYGMELTGCAGQMWLNLELGLNGAPFHPDAWRLWRDHFEDERDGAIGWMNYLSRQSSLTDRISQMARLQLE